MTLRATKFLLAGGLCALLGIGTPAPAAAASPYAVVDSLQMPAWVERNGRRMPLEPGTELHNRDRVLTGAEARVLIRLSEGSAVKLGENAQLDLNALGRRPGNVFTAALDVAKGAFRFTTGLFTAPRQSRAVNVRIATITAGIRGTDLWGSSDAERDLVCLLEGRITVVHELDEAREMGEPMSFYVAPKGQAPKPIERVDALQVSLWAAQTEIADGAGRVRRGGGWSVDLARVGSQSEALALYDRARAAGYAVRIKPQSAGEGAWAYVVRVAQLASRADAEALAVRAGRDLGLAGAAATRG